MGRYWSYDGDDFETHTTAKEAQAAAEERLEWCRDESGDGWDTDIVERIAWGSITEATVMTNRQGHHPPRLAQEADQSLEGTHCPPSPARASAR